MPFPSAAELAQPGTSLRPVEGADEVEFWPDYGSGPLWHRNGEPADLATLGLAPELVERLTDWNSRYEETNLPIDGPGNRSYLDEGSRLLRMVRGSVGPRYRVVVTEPWWGEADV